jgi:hypothetical protein
LYMMVFTMASVKTRRDSVRDVDAGESEAEELDRLARETREKGVSWKSLKAELGL